MTLFVTEEQATAIVSCVCDEPEGSVIRKIREFDLTPENIREFYEKAKKFPTLFGKEISTMENFAQIFLDEGIDGSVRAKGLFWVLDDFVGVYYLTDMIAGVDAKCHYSFFDRRMKGRENISRAMIDYVFDTLQFHRLTVELPFFAQPSFAFVERLGFRQEGRKRSAAYFAGNWYDVAIYGILREGR